MPNVQLLPKTSNPRPTLPAKWNKLLADVDPKPIVKFQTITKDGADVIVGRVKVPTPPTAASPDGSHNYVLRRYDTGFLSWTTMWRATFPLTKPADEKEEIAWLKTNYELRIGTEKEVMRLAGLWISPDLARVLAPSFHLTSIVAALVDASPEEPLGEPSPKPVSNGKASHTTTPAGPNKRRKETHESPANTTPNGISELPLTPASIGKVRKAKSPAPSRSTPSRTVKARKTVSPAPAPAPETSTRPKAVDSDKEETRPAPRRRSAAPKKPAKRDESDNEDTSKAPLPIPEEDITESQNLVQRLKEEAQHTIAPLTQTIKRTRDEAEAPPTLEVAEHSQDIVPVPVEERAVVRNSRVESRWPTLQTLDPNQKAAAWGTIAFAIGWGATTFLPQFF